MANEFLKLPLRKYGWVMALGLIMLLALIVFLVTEHSPAIKQLSFFEQVCGMDIKPFHDEVDDIYYLFMPAYADKGRICVRQPEGFNIRFSANGRNYGSTLADVPLNEPVELLIYPPPSQI